MLLGLFFMRLKGSFIFYENFFVAALIPMQLGRAAIDPVF